MTSQRANCVRELNGRYAIGRELGSGAFSVVVQVTDLKSSMNNNNNNVNNLNDNNNNSNNSDELSSSNKLNNTNNTKNTNNVTNVNNGKKEYACKIFPKSNIKDNGDRERFQREINAMALMTHPSLVSLYDFFWDDENFYLIIDLCEGGELFDYIVENDRLDEDISSFVFCQIVDAIEVCHSYGIAHRDLKPENILITEFPKIKISDFGLCGYISDEKLMSSFCGSPCYCSPECLSKVDYDGRKSDIWSLGIILFAMVTGEHPWNILNTNMMLQQILTATFEVPNYISAECADLIKHLIVVEPDDRLTIQEIKEHPFIRNRTMTNFGSLGNRYKSCNSIDLKFPFSMGCCNNNNNNNNGFCSSRSVSTNCNGNNNAKGTSQFTSLKQLIEVQQLSCLNLKNRNNANFSKDLKSNSNNNNNNNNNNGNNNSVQEKEILEEQKGIISPFLFDQKLPLLGETISSSLPALQGGAMYKKGSAGSIGPLPLVNSSTNDAIVSTAPSMTSTNGGNGGVLTVKPRKFLGAKGPPLLMMMAPNGGGVLKKRNAYSVNATYNAPLASLGKPTLSAASPMNMNMNMNMNMSMNINMTNGNANGNMNMNKNMPMNKNMNMNMNDGGQHRMFEQQGRLPPLPSGSQAGLISLADVASK